MRAAYREIAGGADLLRCYGLDGVVQIPESVDGLSVVQLDSYLFSQTVRGRETPAAELLGEPELCGDEIRELSIPRSVKKVGAYALYNCANLRRLSFYSSLWDWGAGVFTGCSGLKELAVTIVEGEKSSFMEVLQEFWQTLTAECYDESGKLFAKLVFPEFFEESVENTPGRIIMREMHGCGHMYRNCFVHGVFQFGEYDALFPYVKVQEQPELVCRLALYRLFWPRGLTEAAAGEYWEYVGEHGGESAAGLIERGELELLEFAARSKQLSETGLAAMIETAARLGDAQASAILMNARYERRKNGGATPSAQPRRARTFEL